MEHRRKWSWPNRDTNIHLYRGNEENHGRSQDMLGRRRYSNRSPAEEKVLSVSSDLRKRQCPTQYLYNGIFKCMIG
jgi:hypothetical protein